MLFWYSSYLIFNNAPAYFGLFEVYWLFSLDIYILLCWRVGFNFVCSYSSGKRDPEDDLDTKVNLKKQKKDVIAAVQKEKAEKKVPKKVESSDSSDSSDIEEEVKVL